MLCTRGHFILRPKFATFLQLELVQKFVSYATRSKDVPRLGAACKRDAFNLFSRSLILALRGREGPFSPKWVVCVVTAVL
eukprot:s469_g45.t1